MHFPIQLVFFITLSFSLLVLSAPLSGRISAQDEFLDIRDAVEIALQRRIAVDEVQAESPTATLARRASSTEDIIAGVTVLKHPGNKKYSFLRETPNNGKEKAKKQKNVELTDGSTVRKSRSGEFSLRRPVKKY
ncbi:hypothetical protein CPB83DRAFT_855134 [Crepidotus variabilis]|uniref:Uncharacterized protein n=1 Tax=Crepidotus variabilis TaxID=179855 RepID=A0A9P6JPS3_9AGAR|nr:hypothetical protein CPB83DRAFT_855134 [Crepidotus variabilis]